LLAGYSSYSSFNIFYKPIKYGLLKYWKNFIRRVWTMARSYYAILGIPANAGRQEVKSAYRRLAKRYHPDHAGGDSRKFRDIQEAYSVLADENKRRQYEKSRQNTGPVQVQRTMHQRSENLYSHRSPEPLIPEQNQVFSARPDFVKTFDASARTNDDLFGWFFRNFL
jgi:DnaJ-class molecular chaperone